MLVLAIGLAGVFWYLSVNQNNPKNETPIIVDETPTIIDQTKNTDTESNNQNNNQQTESKVSTVSQEDKIMAQLSKMTSAFVERYGSYSNQSDYENLEDLMRIMSKDLKKWAENLIATKRASGQSETVYYGLTTKVLKVQNLSYDDLLGEASFKVSTQRREVVGSIENAKVYYSDAEVNLVKEGGIWKVDQINWLQ